MSKHPIEVLKALKINEVSNEINKARCKSKRQDIASQYELALLVQYEDFSLILSSTFVLVLRGWMEWTLVPSVMTSCESSRWLRQNSGYKYTWMELMV